MAQPKKNGGVTLSDFVSEVVDSAGFGECLRLCDVAELEHVCDLIPEAFAAGRYGQSDAYGLHTSLTKNLYGPVSRFVDELEVWQDKAHQRRQKELEKCRNEECRKRLDRLTLRRKNQVCGPWPEWDDDDEESIRNEMQRPVNTGCAERIELRPSLEFLEHIEGVADHIEFGPWSKADAEACADRLRMAWYKWIACLSSYWMWSKVPRVLAAPKLSKRNGSMPAQGGKPGRPARLDKVAILKAYDDLYQAKGVASAGIVATRFTCDAQTVRKYVRQRDNKKNEPNPVG